jgi:hypothetical protein
MPDNHAAPVPNLIDQRIHLIRGEKVMLDSDLAGLYGVSTRVLNQAVKRNRKRFPEGFMFQLTQPETASLRSQIVISNRGGRRYRPYAFTEHGAVMLATILNSEVAITASIQVVRAFVRLRSVLAAHKELARRLEKLEKTTTLNFAEIYKFIDAYRRSHRHLPSAIGFRHPRAHK